MKDDIRGIALTTDSAAAAAHLDAAIDSVLAHRAEAADLLQQALAADDGLVLALCLKGLSCKILARRELDAPARDAWTAAAVSARRRGATPREYWYLQALGCWIDGDMPRAAAALDAVLSVQPKDLLAIKLAQSIRFMLGDAERMRRSVERARTGYRAKRDTTTEVAEVVGAIVGGVIGALIGGDDE